MPSPLEKSRLKRQLKSGLEEKALQEKALRTRHSGPGEKLPDQLRVRTHGACGMNGRDCATRGLRRAVSEPVPDCATRGLCRADCESVSDCATRGLRRADCEPSRVAAHT